MGTYRPPGSGLVLTKPCYFCLRETRSPSIVPGGSSCARTEGKSQHTAKTSSFGSGHKRSGIHIIVNTTAEHSRSARDEPSPSQLPDTGASIR